MQSYLSLKPILSMKNRFLIILLMIFLNRWYPFSPLEMTYDVILEEFNYSSSGSIEKFGFSGFCNLGN